MQIRSLEEKAKETSLFLAAQNGRIDTIKKLIAEKANVNITNFNNDTPLTWAAYNGHVECVQILIEAKAALDAQNLYGNNAIIEAISLCRTSCIELLINASANVDIQNKKNSSALILACNRGYIKCINMLITAKANLELQDEKNMTAFMKAYDMGTVRSTATLIVAGAKISNHVKYHPKEIIEKLSSADLRFPIIVRAIAKLLQEHQSTLTEEEFKSFETNLQKRKQVLALHKNNIFHSFDNSMSSKMPIALLDLITEYAPISEMSIGFHQFFRESNADSLIEKEKEFESRLCSPSPLL